MPLIALALSLPALAPHAGPHRPSFLPHAAQVYDITPYLNFHPGGRDILLKAAGKDGTALFMKYHPWVNIAALMEKCLLGSLGEAAPPPPPHALDLRMGLSGPSDPQGAHAELAPTLPAQPSRLAPPTSQSEGPQPQQQHGDAEHELQQDNNEAAGLNRVGGSRVDGEAQELQGSNVGAQRPQDLAHGAGGT